jgi:hydroxypyruvate isomerase
MLYSACIEWLFEEVPFKDRIKKAKEFGFDAVEFWGWGESPFFPEKDIKELKSQCKKNDMVVSFFLGNWVNSMIDPREKEGCLEEIKKSIKIAAELDCHSLAVLPSILNADFTCKTPPEDLSEKEIQDNLESVCLEACQQAEKYDVNITIEPLNTKIDHMGYYLESSRSGFELVKRVRKKGYGNIGILFDIYHMQIMEGNIINTIEENIDLIEHVHVADLPGRNEPGTGEINFYNILKRIKESEYKKYIGFEYMPTVSTEQSLGSMKELFQLK